MVAAPIGEAISELYLEKPSRESRPGLLRGHEARPGHFSSKFGILAEETGVEGVLM